LRRPKPIQFSLATPRRTIHTGELLGKFFGAVDRAVGLDNVLVVLTADHGVAPVPEVNAARHMPGGRIPEGILAKTVQESLSRKASSIGSRPRSNP
jgi:hypothetical protein